MHSQLSDTNQNLMNLRSKLLAIQGRENAAVAGMHGRQPTRPSIAGTTHNRHNHYDFTDEKTSPVDADDVDGEAKAGQRRNSKRRGLRDCGAGAGHPHWSEMP